MNIKTTLFLLLLIAVCGGAFLAVRMLEPPAPASETQATLQEHFKPKDITRIAIVHGERQVVLEKGADGWSLPGKWPVREPEVEQLVAVLCNLHSRFAPVPIDGDDDLKNLGLTGAGVMQVTVKAGQDYQLTLGEEKGQPSRFSRPTYLRLGDASEALRVAPGLIAVLDPPQFDRAQERYMQRRLFAVERVAKPDAEHGDKTEQLAAKAVAVKGGSDAYTIVRNGDSWELSAPVRDRAQPDKIKTILTGLADIWADKFVEPGKKTLDDFGLKKPEQVLKVTRPQGDTVTLLVGKVSDKRTRIVPRPGPAQFMPKPQIDVIEEEFRYAKLQDNDQVFEIKGDKLKDIVVAANALRDPQLAHFKTDDVKTLAIKDAGRSLRFVHADGNWKLLVNDKPAYEVERSKVEDLLDKLSALRADGKDIVADKADPKLHGLDKPRAVTVTTEEGKDKKKAEYTFLLGKQEGGAKGKLYVQVAGWDRVNAVDGEVLKLAQRPALAYRSRRVLNAGMLDVTRVDVERGGEQYALERAGGSWRLARPVQADLDLAKASSLPRELSQLEAVEFVTDTPKADDLDKVYGLAKPAATLKIAMSDKKQPEKVLQIGKKREGKDEYYARFTGDNAVFTIKKDAYETLTRESLSLRSAELWTMQPDEIAELRVRRGDEFSLHRDGSAWKLAGPFSARVEGTAVQALTDELAHPKAEKYVAHAASDLAAYGLDNPYLRITVRPAAKKDEKNKEFDTKERVLLVGKPAAKDGKGRYARLGDGEAIFVLGEKALTALDRGPLDLLDRTLIALPDLKSVRTVSGKDSFTFSRDVNDWRVDPPWGSSFIADTAAAADTLRLFTALTADKLVAYGDKVDLAKYGLDKPATTITVTAIEKVPGKSEKTIERKLLIGGEVKDVKGARFARVEGNPAIAVLDAGVVAQLQRTPLDFVNRTVLKLDADKITSLTRTSTEPLELVKKGEHWRIVKPSAQAADDAILQSLTAELAHLRVKKVVAFPAKDKDYSAFGLASPTAVIAVGIATKPDNSDWRRLHIGKLVEDKSGDCYANLDKLDVVFIVPAKLVERLLAAPLAFRDRLLAKTPAVGKLVLERGSRKATFVNQDGAWMMTAPLKANVERLELQDFVTALAELRADKIVAEKPGDLKAYGLDRPQAQWQLFAGDGAKPALTLLIGGKEKDGSRVHAKLAGSDLVVLLSDKLSSLALAELRSRAVWPSLDSFQVEKLSYAYEKDGFTLHKIGSDWHVLGKPNIMVKADAVRDVLDALARLKAEQWVVDRDADLKLFGLEPAFLTVEVDTPTGKRTLKVGRQEGGSNRYYATVVGENSGAVFLLSAADARAIMRPLTGFVAGKS